jgi:hypothetical protein
LDWLVEEVGVPAIHSDEIDLHRCQNQVVRTSFVALCLALAALGPLLEAKMNALMRHRGGLLVASVESQS